MKTILSISQLDLSKKYTYADYLKWKFDERLELIKGFVHKMGPAPKRNHQKVSGLIFYELMKIFKNRKCEIYEAPFDVRLIKNLGKENKEIDSVVQPDICMICDTEKLDDYGCIGAPDFIVEILSKNTEKKMKSISSNFTKKTV